MRWVRVKGYQKQVSINVVHGAAPANLFQDVPSTTLITKITHIGTYLADATLWTWVVWALRIGGGIVPPYDTIKDQMGVQWQPLELSDQPEVQPGQTLAVQAQNTHAATDGLVGIVIRAEQGYYTR